MAHRQLRPPVVIDHVQKWERFSQHINTDNILKSQTEQEALRDNCVFYNYKCLN